MWPKSIFFQRKLRSKFIEDRKLARDILSEIATLLGPNYFPYMLSILEGSLQRGYQLHILVIWFYSRYIWEFYNKESAALLLLKYYIGLKQ